MVAGFRVCQARMAPPAAPGFAAFWRTGDDASRRSAGFPESAHVGIPATILEPRPAMSADDRQSRPTRPPSIPSFKCSPDRGPKTHRTSPPFQDDGGWSGPFRAFFSQPKCNHNTSCLRGGVSFTRFLSFASGHKPPKSRKNAAYALSASMCRPPAHTVFGEGREEGHSPRAPRPVADPAFHKTIFTVTRKMGRIHASFRHETPIARAQTN